ncbi:hypothetical protein [Streptomyces avermitilis]|uniref:hypothetical protein n=1 Tax=Streptomyces avermitilis TaxID=33903 RepID=UPI0037F4FE8E
MSGDANLHDGAIKGGLTAMHRQLVFRPTRGTGRPETPVPGLYLASASAHPARETMAPRSQHRAVALRRERTGALSPSRAG